MIICKLYIILLVMHWGPPHWNLDLDIISDPSLCFDNRYRYLFTVPSMNIIEIVYMYHLVINDKNSSLSNRRILALDIV